MAKERNTPEQGVSGMPIEPGERRAMIIQSNDFQVPEGTTVDLNKWPTGVKALYTSKKQYKKRLNEHVKALSDLQRIHYAYNRYALLLIFQAMDAAGKDSAIRHIMSGVNPQGCQVFSFAHPSAEELDHDFLWRTTRVLPERGRIGIFNRSYYEEVLIVRVHPEILHSQGLPDELLDEQTIWQERYRSIVDLESHLHRNGTRIMKFFLHLSEEEQRKRFLQRIDEPEKNWKFSLADIKERKYWNQYMQAYEACLSATSTETAPWYVVPADDKQKRQAHHFACDCRNAEKPQHALPSADQGAPERIAGHPQTPGEIRLMVKSGWSFPLSCHTVNNRQKE
jgi:PPK2 family polyphosphate:nucleotide phosphotransferase